MIGRLPFAKVVQVAKAVRSLFDYYRASDLLREGSFEEAIQINELAISRSGDLPVHPHVNQVAALARAGRVPEAIQKREEICAMMTNSTALKLNSSTQEYISYYTYGLLPRETILVHANAITMPKPDRIVLSEVSKSIRQNFVMIIPPPFVPSEALASPSTPTASAGVASK